MLAKNVVVGQESWEEDSSVNVKGFWNPRIYQESAVGEWAGGLAWVVGVAPP